MAIVYLMQIGHLYKIGKTEDYRTLGRRASKLSPNAVVVTEWEVDDDAVFVVESAMRRQLYERGLAEKVSGSGVVKGGASETFMLKAPMYEVLKALIEIATAPLIIKSVIVNRKTRKLGRKIMLDIPN